MSYHDDTGRKQAHGKKRKVIPPGERRTVSDCEPGDVVEFCDGRMAIVTSHLNGGPFGRHYDEDGNVGEFMSLDAGRPIVRLRGSK